MKTLALFILLLTPLFCASIEVKEAYAFNEDTYTIEDVLNNRVPFQTQVLKRSEKKSAQWIRLTFNNPSSITVQQVVTFLDHRIDQLDIYDTQAVMLYSMGDTIAFNTRNYHDAQIAFDMRLQPLESKTFYIQVRSKGNYDLDFLVQDADAYSKHMFIKHQFFAFYFGAMTLMLLYNLILFIFIRQQPFGYYVLYHVGLIIVMFYYSGYMVMYHSENENGHDHGGVPPLLIVLSLLFATQFARTFLDIKRITPRWDKVLLFFMFLNTVLGVLIFIVSDTVLVGTLLIVVMMIQSLVLMMVGIYHWGVKKRKLALFYFLGWIFMAVGVIITGLLSLGAVERDFFTIFAFKMGSLFEVLLLSMGLAYRYNEQQAIIIEKDKALKQINSDLENTVLERTKKLEEETNYTKSLLNDREILFKELYHRIKNNLQMITSILSMQNRRLKEQSAIKALNDAQSRVKSIALIHEKLQTTDGLDTIDVANYLETLLADIQRGYFEKSVHIGIESEFVTLNIEQMTSLGLIVNELATNSFKYAFKTTKEPSIHIVVTQKEDQIYFSYSDNGTGIDEKSTPSLGTLLIETLAIKQLKGSCEINAKEAFTFSLRFPNTIET